MSSILAPLARGGAKHGGCGGGGGAKRGGGGGKVVVAEAAGKNREASEGSVDSQKTKGNKEVRQLLDKGQTSRSWRCVTIWS